MQTYIVIGSISRVRSLILPEERVRAHFPEQRLVIESNIVMVSGSILNLSTHLTPHMTLSIETCIGLLNTGFSISLFPFRSPPLTPEWRAFSIHCYLKIFH